MITWLHENPVDSSYALSRRWRHQCTRYLVYTLSIRQHSSVGLDTDGATRATCPVPPSPENNCCARHNEGVISLGFHLLHHVRSDFDTQLHINKRVCDVNPSVAAWSPRQDCRNWFLYYSVSANNKKGADNWHTSHTQKLHDVCQRHHRTSALVLPNTSIVSTYRDRLWKPVAVNSCGLHRKSDRLWLKWLLSNVICLIQIIIYRAKYRRLFFNYVHSGLVSCTRVCWYGFSGPNGVISLLMVFAALSRGNIAQHICLSICQNVWIVRRDSDNTTNQVTRWRK